MYSEELMVLAMQLAIAISMGLLGAVTNMYLKKKAGELPGNVDLYGESYLGFIAGLLIYLSTVFPDWRGLAFASLMAGLSSVETIKRFNTARKLGR